MVYDRLADAVVLLHFVFILFVVFGALLAWAWRWIVWLHLPALAWGAAIEFLGFVCPLTYVENALRARAGTTGYRSDFIEQYLIPVMYPADLTREWQWTLGILLLAFNLILYALLWPRLRLRRP